MQLKSFANPYISGNLAQSSYSPFGSVLLGRDFSGESYRFGFGGKEKNSELNSDNYDFGARIYDGRIGRFLSIDPDFKKYANWSTYIFSINNPIKNIDFEGRGPIDAILKVNAAANESANKAWKESFNEDKSKVNEVGFLLVQSTTVIKLGTSETIKDEIVVRNYTISEHPDNINLNKTVNNGEKIVGDLHTHPYSLTEGSHLGIAFSPKDISNLRYSAKNDYVKLVESGTKRFALVITDEKKAEAFFKGKSEKDFKKEWDACYDNLEGSMQENVKTAITSIIGTDSGISFYQSDYIKEKFTEIKANEN
jgi:RHS repeat-associated protein